MGTTLTVKGQVTIPKPIRDRLRLRPGDQVTFEPDEAGRIIVRKAGTEHEDPSGDRFARIRGRATAGLTTAEIMALTRGED